MKTELIIVCPHCKNRVLPKADGTCPSCRKNVTQRSKRETQNKISKPTGTPDKTKKPQKAGLPPVAKDSSNLRPEMKIQSVQPIKKENMQLRIDFYGKNEMSVTLNVQDRGQFQMRRMSYLCLRAILYGN